MKNPVVWFEIAGKEPETLLSFYGKMFDWELKRAPSGIEYHMMDKVEEGIPGGIGVGISDLPTGWATFYVQVESVAGSLQQAQELGGTMVLPVTTLPDGMEVAVFRDPEENFIGLVSEPNKDC